MRLSEPKIVAGSDPSPAGKYYYRESSGHHGKAICADSGC
jgi:hypothetical protein